MFKQLCSMAALVVAAAAPLPAAAQPNVSVNIGQSGFYGRIDIGNVPPPQLIYPQPVIIQQPSYQVQRAPIYLRVPPGHAKDWRRHCARYRACGQPVYFVQDRWYRDVYSPHWREQAHGPRRGEAHGRELDDRRGHGKHKQKHRGKHRGKQDH